MQRKMQYLDLRVCGRLTLCLLLVFMAGCAGKSLQDWHTDKLSAEFTVEDAEDVVTFADYQALEDRVFAELEEVYLPPSPDNLIMRYSKGSAADPLVREPNWNRSYELTVPKPVGGVLLLHGMSDSPYSLRAMALQLQQRGYHVLGLRMPGHGTAPSGMVHVNWQDMAAVVDLGMAHLKKRLADRPIQIVGYSTGATLALDYALRAVEGSIEPLPAGLVLISPAVGVTAAAGLAKIPKGISKLPGFKGLAWTQIAPEFDPYKYNSFTTNAGDQVYKITQSVSKRLGKLSQEQLRDGLPPILVFHSTVDATVSTDALVDRLLKRLDPGRHELVIFDINRFGATNAILVSDPGPVTQRLLADEKLPVAVTFISNENTESIDVVAYHKLALQGELDSVEPLGLAWPNGVISLSHVALPIPPDDPLYGNIRPEDENEMYLGELNIKGERGLLRIPADWLLRLRYNPFYSYLEARTFDWMDAVQGEVNGAVEAPR